MENEKVENIINLINNTIAKNYTVSVWVPSLINTVHQAIYFKTLNVSQQKNLIAIAIEQDIYNTNYINELYNIISTNYISNDLVPLDSLTILDKLFITVALRANINSRYTFTDTAVEVDLNELLNNLKILVELNKIPFVSKNFNQEGIDIYCALPNIKTELLCEKAREIVSDENVNDKIKKLISEAVSEELTKFTNKIILQAETIELSVFSFQERKNIIEQLPAFILEQSLSYVLDYKQAIDAAFTFNLPNSQQEITKNVLQLNGSFFATM